MTTFTTQDRQDAQRTPLTDNDIGNLWNQYARGWKDDMKKLYEFARAIEAAHGIGE